MAKMDTWDFPRPQCNIFAISVQGQRCRETGRVSKRGRGLENVCASFLKRVFPLPAPVVLKACVYVCVLCSFEGHPVRDCSTALSHPHTSLPFYLTVHLSTYLPPETGSML